MFTALMADAEAIKPFTAMPLRKKKRDSSVGRHVTYTCSKNVTLRILVPRTMTRYHDVVDC